MKYIKMKQDKFNRLHSYFSYNLCKQPISKSIIQRKKQIMINWLFSYCKRQKYAKTNHILQHSITKKMKSAKLISLTMLPVSNKKSHISFIIKYIVL